MKNNITTIEFTSENLNFSSGHFTIFSKTHREKIHGHTYRVKAAITAEIIEPGITFDYAIYSEKLLKLCKSLHTYFLIPENSPYLEITKKEKQIELTFNNEKLYFPESDVKFLPIVNVTLEELSNYFLEQLCKDKNEIQKNKIQKIKIKVFNGPAHGGVAKIKFD